MDSEQIKKILDSPLSSPEQKAKAQAALTDYEAPKSGGFTTLTGSQHICLGSSYETCHFQITVESGYAGELLQTRTMDQAAKTACNDRLIGGLRAKYDASEDDTFQKRFPKDCYKVLRIEKGATQ
jgi:hypothetical protein